MESMFEGAESFNRDLSEWNVKSVTNMKNMFKGAKKFNGDISSWNVERVLNMENMFEGAEVFVQNISEWNIAVGTLFTVNLNNIFKDATAFKSANPNINNNGMFVSGDYTSPNYFNDYITYLDDDNINGAVNDWVNNRSNIGSLGDIVFWNTQRVTDMKNLFLNRANFNDNISQWDVSNVNNMKNMFKGAKNLTGIYQVGMLNT